MLFFSKFGENLWPLVWTLYIISISLGFLSWGFIIFCICLYEVVGVATSPNLGGVVVGRSTSGALLAGEGQLSWARGPMACLAGPPLQDAWIWCLCWPGQALSHVTRTSGAPLAPSQPSRCLDPAPTSTSTLEREPKNGVYGPQSQCQ